MPIVYHLQWRVTAGEYAATIAYTVPALPDVLSVYLRGSYGKDMLRARSVEIDGRLTTGAFTVLIDSIPRTVAAGSFQSYNFLQKTDRFELSGGNAGDLITLNFYPIPKIEWR